jgi:hypothetical protein
MRDFYIPKTKSEICARLARMFPKSPKSLFLHMGRRQLIAIYSRGMKNRLSREVSGEISR